MNEAGTAIRRDGNLASIGAKGVVLLVPSSLWTQQRRKVPHEDILCISISNYISDVRETQATPTNSGSGRRLSAAVITFQD